MLLLNAGLHILILNYYISFSPYYVGLSEASYTISVISLFDYVDTVYIPCLKQHHLHKIQLIQNSFVFPRC